MHVPTFGVLSHFYNYKGVLSFLKYHPPHLPNQKAAKLLSKLYLTINIHQVLLQDFWILKEQNYRW